MLGFIALGFRHAQRTPTEEDLLTPKRSPALAGASS
jgi:hypothetical protein